jgi:hypothetical protein
MGSDPFFRPIGDLERPGVQWALVAVCVLLIVVGTWSVLRLRAVAGQLESLQTAAEHREQQLTEQLAQARADGASFAAELEHARRRLEAASSASHTLVALDPIVKRNRGGPERRIALPENAEVVDLQLGLPSGARSQSYRALLRSWSSGEEIWSQGRLDASGKTLLLYVPVSVLRPGAYELILSATTPAGARQDLAFYEFAIVK